MGSGVLIDIDEDLSNIPKQFISIKELLELLASLENVTIEQSAQWLLNNIHTLNESKKLILKNSYTLIEYEYSESNFYNCPVDTIRLIASGEDEGFSSEYVGFSRYQLLNSLESIGLNINKNLFLNVRPYISKSCFENDDNFYKKQCIYLVRELDKLRRVSTQKPQKLSDIHKHAIFLNKDNQLYCRGMALLGRLNYEFNVLGNYGGRSNKEDKIKDFLKYHGAEYGFRDPKPFNYKAISSLIDLIKDQKPTIEILDELEIETKEKSH